jgi:hypothetical protein
VHKSGKHKITDVTVTSNSTAILESDATHMTNKQILPLVAVLDRLNYKDGLKIVASCHIFLESGKLDKTSSTQSCDISPPPYIALNPHLSIIPAQCQLKKKAVRTCVSNNTPLLTAEKIPPINVHHHMQAVHRDKCVDVSTVRVGYGI